MSHELIMPIGTSMLTGWVARVDPAVRLPSAWVGTHPCASKDVGGLDPKDWIPRLATALNQGRTCAELDSTRRWLARAADARVSRVTLLVSDTEAAVWVASVIEALLPRLIGNAVEVDSRKIPRLHAADMQEGLVEFVRISAEAIRAALARGARPVVNATPGFKAETAFLTLLGALLGADTVYLHEQMQDVIVVPAMPLRWDLEPHEVRRLRQVGQVASRDMARDLGIGSLRRLWAFVEHIGEGTDELWGLSALGQMVIESSDEGAVEEPPPRDDDFEFRASEVGHHIPKDTEKLANRIAQTLSFIRRAEPYRLGRRGCSGLLRPQGTDSANGLIRVRLQSDCDDTRVYLFLRTTARTEEQWKFARQRVAQTLGRVSLVDELDDEASEQEDDARAGSGELAQLRAEELLQHQLNLVEAKVEVLESRLDERDRDLKRGQEAIEMRTSELEGEREKGRQRKAQLERQGTELAELRVQALSLTEEVQSLRAALESRQEVPPEGGVPSA